MFINKAVYDLDRFERLVKLALERRQLTKEQGKDAKLELNRLYYSIRG